MPAPLAIKVLVADDIGTVRAVVKTLLLSLNVPSAFVFEASDGAEALRVIRDEQPRLVITDWNMPNADGLAVADAAHAASAGTRVIFLTSNAARGEVTDAIRHGADDYVIKPFARSVLIDKLSFWLRKLTSEQPARTPATVDPIDSSSR